MGNRVKLLRRSDNSGNSVYPLMVCETCGRYAAEDSRTEVYKELDLRLGHCGVCAANVTPVGVPQQFGFPTFFTYENGQPVRGGS